MRKSTSSRGASTPPASAVGRDKQKGRTRSALLAAASGLLAQGRTPTVADVADKADVSRRTAYRYFTTQEQMLVEAALEGLRPRIEREIIGPSSARESTEAPRAATIAGEPIEARLDRTVRAIQRNAVENEALLRTMIRLTVGPFPPSEDAEGPRRRGYRRIEWVELALAPVKSQLGARRHARLVSALTVCLGIDALIVLQDLRGLTAAEAEATSRWMAQSLLQASLAERGESTESKKRPSAPKRA